MNRIEHEQKILELIESYNEILEGEVVDMNKLNDAEELLKAASKASLKDMQVEVYGFLMSKKDPMLAACYLYEFAYPSYVIEKKDGRIEKAVPTAKMAAIRPYDFAKDLIRQGEFSSCPYEKTGVVKHGARWEHRAGKLAYLMTYRVIKDLNLSPEQVSHFENYYKIKELAAKEELGETPASNSQICKLLQSIVDLMVYVPSDKGDFNAIKVRSCDAAFLVETFTKKGRGVGVVECLKGNKIRDYIFEICHMIVSGKSYSAKYPVRKDAPEVVLAEVPEVKEVFRSGLASLNAPAPKKAKKKVEEKSAEEKPAKVSRRKKSDAPAAAPSETPVENTAEVLPEVPAEVSVETATEADSEK